MHPGQPQPVAAQSWGGVCWAPSAPHARLFLSSNLPKTRSFLALLISSLRRGLKTEVAQWSDTLSAHCHGSFQVMAAQQGPAPNLTNLLCCSGCVCCPAPCTFIYHTHIFYYTLKIYISIYIWNCC